MYDIHISKVFKQYQTRKVCKGSVYINDETVSTLRNKAYYNYKSFAGNFTVVIEGVLFFPFECSYLLYGILLYIENDPDHRNNFLILHMIFMISET